MSLHISPILTKYGFRKITQGEYALVQSEMMGNHEREVDTPLHVITHDGTLDIEITETIGMADCGLVDLIAVSVWRPGSIRTMYWYKQIFGDLVYTDYPYGIANRLADNANVPVYII